MARTPDKQEAQDRLAKLDVRERRAIVRAVNRGRAVQKRAHAPLAVSLSRRQQRFWKFAWLLGPVIGLIQLLISDAQSALINMIVGTVALAMMSVFWSRRAQRAERLNLEIVEGKRGVPSGGRAPSRPSWVPSWLERFWRSPPDAAAEGEQGRARSSGHLPGDVRRASRAPTDSSRRRSDGDGQRAGGNRREAPKPPTPRGKKRR